MGPKPAPHEGEENRAQTCVGGPREDREGRPPVSQGEGPLKKPALLNTLILDFQNYVKSNFCCLSHSAAQWSFATAAPAK